MQISAPMELVTYVFLCLFSSEILILLMLTCMIDPFRDVCVLFCLLKQPSLYMSMRRLAPLEKKSNYRKANTAVMLRKCLLRRRQ